MFTPKHLISGSLFVFVIAGTALAQETRATMDDAQAPVSAGPLVTATATAERVRFVSPGSVTQLRLEVYNEAGQKLFDTQLHGGNVLDWPLQDGAGQRLAAGSYACVLTTKSLSGRLSQRVGLVTVNDKVAAIEPAGTAPLSQLSLAQQQVIGPVEGNATFTVLRQTEAITTVTHDGADGQMTRTRGALSFRVGDFFSGKDSEQMRLTEDGNLGLGTDNPQAKLEVAGDVHASGTIRASKGIEFTDGTVQTTGLSGRKDSEGNLMPNVAGTGTQNRLAKWTDNAGTLGNSNVTEAASGKLGIGTVNPNYEITLFGNDVGLQLISAATGVTANDGFRFGLSSTNHAFLWNTEATDLYFGTTASERMRITAAGNVGIGTNNPTTALDVVGKINTSTEYHIGGARMLSNAGTSNLFIGVSAGRDNTPGIPLAQSGSRNAFVGHLAGASNTSGYANAFFGNEAGLNNTTGIHNSFFGAFAGSANTTGFQNAFFGNFAGPANTIGNYNSFFGSGAGGSNTTGSYNSFFGSAAGNYNTTGSRNSFFGPYVGLLNTTGGDNSFFGYSAGDSNTTGDLNSFFGTSAGASNTTGSENSFFGKSAGDSNTTGDANSFFGNNAGNNNTTGFYNSFFGSSAGRSNTTGVFNSFFGQDAGNNNTTGNDNSFFGFRAGISNTTGNDNSFFGYSAGDSNTTGVFNSFFGNHAGDSNTTGGYNSFFGYAAGSHNTTGDNNAFFGKDAGRLTDIGSGNTFVGTEAGEMHTEGINNTFVGRAAGNTNTTGGANTVIGYNADVGSSGLVYATAIGALAVVNNSNSVVLGRAADTVRIPGDLIVTGTVSKGGGSFKIDHPLDPANKTLAHSFVESPDMMNVYNGTTTTDAHGGAVVTLPNYFEALNRDFRYQLTVIGQFAQAIVLHEIKGNRFRIKTNRPRVKVSWQVTGVRQDAYANARRIPTEELKPQAERGTYLHPDLFTPKPTATTAMATGARSGPAKCAP